MARGWLLTIYLRNASALLRGPAKLGLAIVIAASACGPVVYVNEVTRRASTAVEEARAVQADKHSPYYWTRATQYLKQAQVLAAHSDFQGANRFGRLASEAATKAIEEATAAGAKGAP